MPIVQEPNLGCKAQLETNRGECARQGIARKALNQTSLQNAHSANLGACRSRKKYSCHTVAN